MKSLSVKLTVVFVVGILLVSTGAIVQIERYHYAVAVKSALQDAEMGPAFLNGVTPSAADYQSVSNGTLSAYSLRPSDIQNRMERFKPLVDTMVAGGVNVSPSISGPVNVDHTDYFNLTFKVTNIESGGSYEVGPLMVNRNSFPATILAYSYATQRANDFYYLPVQGHDNVIMLASLNSYTFPIRSWQQQARSDISQALPFMLTSAAVFALLVVWITIRPLRRITHTIELASRSDLSQRVKYKSGDEIGRLARSFNGMADRLEESFNLQTRFVSDAAHEMRTPLASMKTSVTSALSHDRGKAEYQTLLGFLFGRIDHMQNMVNDLLFLSRVDEGKSSQKEDVVDLSEALNDSAEAFKYVFENKGVDFSTTIAPDLCIKGDRRLILGAISNLLDNAAKNTPPGGLVSLEGVPRSRGVVVTVSDTGPGIPPEHLDHVFDRFYRIPGSPESSDGYGLGLAISKNIIVSAGGRLYAHSEPGKGSVFTVELPRFQG